MVRAAGPKRRHGRPDDDLQEHGDGHDGVAEIIADAGPALAGRHGAVHALVCAGELGLVFGVRKGFFAPEEVAFGFGRLGCRDAEGAVEGLEGVERLGWGCRVQVCGDGADVHDDMASFFFV